MKYFTPQLWIAFQGPRRNAAFKTWGRRFEQYRKSLETILPGLRPSARRFFQDALVLHDGTLTRLEVGDRIDDIGGKATRDLVNRRTLRVRMFVLADVVKQRRVTGKCWHILEYKQVERIGLSYPGDLKLFPVGLDLNFGDWGYDELTSSNEKIFRHEILFASGATITIDFRDFSFRRRKPAKGYHKR
ncbi:MAG TPA: hypothetical protein VGH17_00485 [Candidatus Acidoferrales bacterium]|jgi:hypothetical protein